jgi:hypothetical protein
MKHSPLMAPHHADHRADHHHHRRHDGEHGAVIIMEGSLSHCSVLSVVSFVVTGIMGAIMGKH